MKYLKTLIKAFAIMLIVSSNTIAQPIFNWNKATGGASNEKTKSMAVDASGNVIVLGTFSGTVDFDPSVAVNNLTSVSAQDVFIAKYDIMGALLWAKQISSTVEIIPREIKIDNWGGIVYCGSFKGNVDFDPSSIGTVNKTSAGGYDGFIARLKSNGDYDNQNGYARIIGSTGDDYINSFILTSNNQIAYVAGTFTGTVNFGGFQNNQYSITASGARDIFITKILGNSGSSVYTAHIGGTNAITCEKIASDNNNHLFISGKFNTTVDFDVDLDEPAGSGPDTAHNYLSTGSFQTNTYLVMYNTQFAGITYAKNLGNLTNSAALESDASGNVYISGTYNGTKDFDPSTTTNNLTAVGAEDIYLAKFDLSGNHIWAKSIGGMQDEYSSKISINTFTSKISLTGSFAGNNVDFNPDNATHFLNSNGLNDAFFASYTFDGLFDFAYNIGGAGDDEGISIGNYYNFIYLAGNFSGANVDFDLTNGSQLVTSSGLTDLYLTQYMQCNLFDKNVDVQTLYISSNTSPTILPGVAFQWLDCGNNYSIMAGETNQFYQPGPGATSGPFAAQMSYNGCVDTSFCASLMTVDLNKILKNEINIELLPNPANQVVGIKVSSKNQEAFSIEIIDVLGKSLMYLNNIQSNKLQLIDVSSFNSGMYSVIAKSSNTTQVQKIIISNK